jgi:hypothetical protein
MILAHKHHLEEKVVLSPQLMKRNRLRDAAVPCVSYGATEHIV